MSRKRRKRKGPVSRWGRSVADSRAGYWSVVLGPSGPARSNVPSNHRLRLHLLEWVTSRRRSGGPDAAEWPCHSSWKIHGPPEGFSCTGSPKGSGSIGSPRSSDRRSGSPKGSGTLPGLRSSCEDRRRCCFPFAAWDLTHVRDQRMGCQWKMNTSSTGRETFSWVRKPSTGSPQDHSTIRS